MVSTRLSLFTLWPQKVFLQQRIGLRYLPLVIVQNPQSTHRHRIVCSEAEHLPIFLFGLDEVVILEGGVCFYTPLN